MGDFPGSPVVKTSPPSTGGAGSIPDVGSQDPSYLMAKKPERKQQKQYCNKFSKHLKKYFFNKNIL